MKILARFAGSNVLLAFHFDEEVHRAGLSEAETIRKRMDEAQVRFGFSGSRDEFRESLWKNPRFFPRTPEESGRR